MLVTKVLKESTELNPMEKEELYLKQKHQQQLQKNKFEVAKVSEIHETEINNQERLRFPGAESWDPGAL